MTATTAVKSGITLPGGAQGGKDAIYISISTGTPAAVSTDECLAPATFLHSVSQQAGGTRCRASKAAL